MDNPLISVIVPVYNVEKYLDRCVESIANQTYTNLEIILVDDGSPDNCPAMCDAWAEKDSRIKVIHKENGGVSSARNTGINAASGRYVGFVDSDDYIDSCMYEVLLEEHIKNNCQLTVCGIVFQGETICFNKSETINNITAEKMLFDFENYQSFSGWSCNKLFDLEIIRQQEILFDENFAYCEDVLFVYHYLKRIDRVLLVNKSLYNYMYRKDACTAKKNYKNDSSILDMIDYFIANENNASVKQQIVKWSVRNWSIASRNYLLDRQEKNAYIIARRRIMRYLPNILISNYYKPSKKLECIIIVICPYILPFLLRK